MGQKVHPFGFRLGFNKTWRSRWYSDRDYAKLLHEDLVATDIIRDVPGAVPFPWVPVAEKGKRLSDAAFNDDAQYVALSEDPGRKIHPALGRNRCIEDVYEPGSTFKPFVWSTITELGLIKPDKLIDISEATVATALVAVLLPPAVVPPLVSLVAPVVTDAVVVPDAVGVPETEHVIDAPAATVAGGVGVHVPTVTPGGRPLMLQVALVALAIVSGAAFAQSPAGELKLQEPSAFVEGYLEKPAGGMRGHAVGASIVGVRLDGPVAPFDPANIRVRLGGAAAAPVRPRARPRCARDTANYVLG